jgi:hypothetical protein
MERRHQEDQDKEGEAEGGEADGAKEAEAVAVATGGGGGAAVSRGPIGTPVPACHPLALAKGCGPKGHSRCSDEDEEQEQRCNMAGVRTQALIQSRSAICRDRGTRAKRPARRAAGALIRTDASAQARDAQALLFLI